MGRITHVTNLVSWPGHNNIVRNEATERVMRQVRVHLVFRDVSAEVTQPIRDQIHENLRRRRKGRRKEKK